MGSRANRAPLVTLLVRSLTDVTIMLPCYLGTSSQFSYDTETHLLHINTVLLIHVYCNIKLSVNYNLNWYLIVRLAQVRVRLTFLLFLVRHCSNLVLFIS